MGEQTPAAARDLSELPIGGAHLLKMQLCWPVFLQPTSTPSTHAMIRKWPGIYIMPKPDRLWNVFTFCDTWPSRRLFHISPLLRRKNRLMQAGRVEEASAFADRVRKCIQRATGAQLRDLYLRGDPNNITKGKAPAVPDTAPTAEQFNEHFARLSPDDH